MSENLFYLTTVAGGLLVFFFFLTHKRKSPPDTVHEVRRSMQRLFEFAVRQDYQAAASLLAKEDDILRFSQEPQAVKERCQPLQEMASQGGVSIDRVIPQGNGDYPDYVLELSLIGARRSVSQQRWRWVKGRYALAGE
jgi:hypothetical protein